MASATSENGHALSVTESAKLENLESVIDGGLKSFIEVGRSLMEIREGKLYRVTHMTFSEYCRDRWDMTDSYANMLVASVKVSDEITTNCCDSVQPQRESQVRPLSKLPEGERASAWMEAVEAAPNGKPTAAIVEQVVASRLPEESRDDQPSETKAAKEEAKERVEREAADYLVEFQANVNKVCDGGVYTLETISDSIGMPKKQVTWFVRMCDVSPFVKVHRNMGRRGLVQYTFEKTNAVTAHARIRQLAKQIADDQRAPPKSQSAAQKILSLLGG